MNINDIKNSIQKILKHKGDGIDIPNSFVDEYKKSDKLFGIINRKKR
jgi:hypothetical protein